MKNLLKTLTLIMLLTFTFGTVNAEELSFQELQQLMVEKNVNEVVSKFEASYNKQYLEFEAKLKSLTQRNIDKRNWDKAIIVYEKAISKIDLLLSKEITVKSKSVTSERIRVKVVELKRNLFEKLKTLIEEELIKIKDAKTEAETIRVGTTEKEKKEIKEEILTTASVDLSAEDYQKAKQEIVLNGGKESMFRAATRETTLGDTFETCAVFYPSDYPSELLKFFGQYSVREAIDANIALNIKYGFERSQASNTNKSRVIKCIQQNPKDLTREEYSELYKTLYGKTLTVAPKAWYELTDDYSDLDSFIDKYIK